MKSATPRTDKHMAGGSYSFSGEFARKLEQELNEAIGERNILRNWKNEMLTVHHWWEEIESYIRNHPDTVIGRLVTVEVLRFLKERDEALQRIDNLEASGIHSCGTHCQRPACKARRERDEARQAAKDLAKTVLLHVREHEDEQGVRLAREWA